MDNPKYKKILDRIGLGGKEEAIAKTISDLTDEEKIEFVTNLHFMEDDNIACLLTIAERYNLTWLKHWVNAKLKLRTSVGGWRANQLVNIASEKRKEVSRFAFLKRIFGREKKGLGETESFE